MQLYPIFRQTCIYMWYTMLCRIYCIKTGRQWYIVHYVYTRCLPCLPSDSCWSLKLSEVMVWRSRNFFGREAKDFPKLYVLVGHTKRTMAASSFCPQSCGVQDGGQIHLQWLTWLTSPCSNPILNHAATGRLIVRGWEYCYSHNFQLRCPLTAEPGRCPQSSGMTPQLAGDLNRRFPLWPSSPACPWCSPYPQKRCRKASIDHDL